MDSSVQAGKMWIAGFREACCLHRAITFCSRSRMLSLRTWQCFLLNGIFFLGSMYLLNSAVVPSLYWLLPSWREQHDSKVCCIKKAMPLYAFLRSTLVQLFYICWFYPLYVFSLILSTIWYSDIAAHAFTSEVIEFPASDVDKSMQTYNVNQKQSFAGVHGAIIGISEQLYSFLLLNIFFLEVWATSFVPFIGSAINFMLLSWMYAYYCFEYKWNIVKFELERRLNFFESNWAFFAGFGSPCVMALFFCSRLLGYGIMATLFPLFVLTAMGTDEERIIDSSKKQWRGSSKKIPIFYIADALVMKILQLFPSC